MQSSVLILTFVLVLVLILLIARRRHRVNPPDTFSYDPETFGYDPETYTNLPNPPTPTNLVAFSELRYVTVFQYFTLRADNPERTRVYCLSNNDPSLLRQFVTTKLPGIKHSFKIILAHGDHGTSNLWTLLPPVLAHPRLLRVYMVNCDRAHPKLRSIPIGLDLHTTFFRERIAPQAQEEILHQIRQSLPRPYDRPAKAYSTATLVLSDASPMHNLKGGRQRIRDRFAQSMFIHLESEHVDRRESWLRHGEYLFVLSPAGNGLDCHRTWEALILGNIPILQHSPIDALYADLPVAFVDSWDEITPQRLIEWKREFLHPSRVYNWDKLTWSYWKRFIEED